MRLIPGLDRDGSRTETAQAASLRRFFVTSTSALVYNLRVALRLH